MWPRDFKFLLAKPTLIYQSKIEPNGNVHTMLFPSVNNSEEEKLRPLTKYCLAKTVTGASVKNVIRRFSPETNVERTSKSNCLKILETIRTEKNISNGDLCDAFAEEIYLPLIMPHKDIIPESIKIHYKELQ